MEGLSRESLILKVLERTLDRLDARVSSTQNTADKACSAVPEEKTAMRISSKDNRENFQRWLTAPQSLSQRTLEIIYRDFQGNLSSILSVTNPNAFFQQQARAHLRPNWSIFSSTEARYLKLFLRQYSPPFELTPNDWRTFL